MGKQKSFAEKMLKSEDKITCPTCNNTVEMVKVVDSMKNSKTNSNRVTSKIVPVCKCNEAEVYA